MRRLITIEVEASGRHCGDCCPHRRVFLAGSSKCALFSTDLAKSYKRRQNADLRAAACRQADAGEALAKGGEEKR